MPLTVFVPGEVAERCYLYEALLWTMVNRFPLAELTLHDVDSREDDEYLEGIEPHFPDGSPLSALECDSIGLPACPEWEERESGNYHLPPDDIEDLFRRVGPDHEERPRLERELAESKAFHARQAPWDAEFDAISDLYKARLFIALREGRIRAHGRCLPGDTCQEGLKRLETISWEMWHEVEWTPIPAGFWVSDKIDWEGCRADGRGGAYCLILVEFSQLFDCFPPNTQPAHGVVRVGEVLSVVEDGATPTRSRGNRGRRPLPWDVFHVEVARRLRDGAVPRKQEAFIAEMQTWCLKNWGKDVGRSTVLLKVKPYFDELIRKSENPAD